MTKYDLFFFLCEFMAASILLVVMWVIFVFICCL